MLDGLDAIDWGSFEHAYGPATDVPDWLHALAGDDADARVRALGAIDAALNHQGWISPAAIPTVPFLAELFRAGVERASLAVMLADMGVGGFHGNDAIEPLDPRSMPSEWRPMRETVVAEHELFAALLDDEDSKVRAAGAVALSTLQEVAEVARAALRARIAREKAQEPLACMVLALARLDVGATTAEDLETFAKLASHESAMVVLAARIASAQLAPSKEAALAALAAAESRPVRERNVPYNGGELADLAVRVAIHSLASVGDVDGLASLIARAGLDRVLAPALDLLLGHMGTKRPPDPKTLDEVPPRAREFIEIVALTIAELRAKNAWFNPTLLEHYGLCDIERLVGLQAVRPLDERFEGEPRWRIARRVRDGRLPREAWPKCIENLGQDGIEDVVRDLALSSPIPYALSQEWPEGRWGYECEVAAWVPYDALTADAARGLTLERLTQLMEWISSNPKRGRVVPIVDVYTEKLEGRAPDPRFDAALSVVLDQLHSDGGDVRRILSRVPPERREAIAAPLYFNFLIGSANNRQRAAYFRVAWHYVDLVPGAAFVKRAAESFAGLTQVLPEPSDMPKDAREVLREEIVAGLVARFGACGPGGRKAVEPALAGGTPASRPILEAVLARL